MGFLSSYRRLTKNQKISFGVAGMVFAMIAPYFTDKFQVFFDEQQQREKTLKDNFKKLKMERQKESLQHYELLKERKLESKSVS